MHKGRRDETADLRFGVSAGELLRIPTCEDEVVRYFANVGRRWPSDKATHGV
jgi:hypothetical protein